MLKSVRILEAVYPCWAYALNRTNRECLFTKAWIEKEMPRLLQPYENYANKLQESDFIVWDAKERKTFNCPVFITFDGHIITEKIKYLNHVCVYEGNGFVTDMVKSDVNFAIPFIIRKRRLEELSTPDYVIRFESKE